MKSLGKFLFWIGFIVLIGVVMAYLIIMLAGALAFVTTSSVLILCGVIFVGSILMLIGRTYERRGEHKEEGRRLMEIQTNLSQTEKKNDVPNVIS